MIDNRTDVLFLLIIKNISANMITCYKKLTELGLITNKKEMNLLECFLYDLELSK